MKNMFRFSALLCAMAVLVTSCTKDETLEPQRKPAAIGDQIVFGARAGFENGNPDSRTVYSGETYEITNSDSTKTFERIDWVTGDIVEIYSPQATGTNPAHYTVTQDSVDPDGNKGNSTGDQHDEGYLTTLSEGGLQWGSNEDHTFYAMYPSSTMFDPTSTLAQGVKLSTDLKMVGIVPRAQQSIGWDETQTSDDNYGNYIAKPDMRYAYMAAKKTVAPSASVSLDFVPVVTAVEIELQAQDLVIPITELYVSGTGIAGQFTANLGAWQNDPNEENYSTYPTCEASDENSEYDQIIFSIPEAIELQPGKSLKFTVFMRPHANVSDLKIGFSQTGSDTKYKDMSKIQIPAKCKTVIKDVLLPADEKALEIDASKWMSQLPEGTAMGYLSLPGTGGSFSFAYGESDAASYKQQTLDIDAQWKAGIRAFEIVVDRSDDGPWYNKNNVAALTDEPVKCNKQHMGSYTFDTAMQKIESMVTTNSSECAVVVITYQPEGSNKDNEDAPDRHCERFATSLYKWWTAIGTTRQGKYALYKPTAKLGGETDNVQGKILVLVRMNQQHENESGNISDAETTITACPFVVVEGCGTAKDRWGARGYEIGGTDCYHMSNGYSSSDSNMAAIENHMEGALLTFTAGEGNAKQTAKVTTGNTEYTITRPAYYPYGATDLNFNFTTNQSYGCWYQDWARVVKTPISDQAWTYIYYIDLPLVGNQKQEVNGTISWFDSLAEKKSNIEHTFNMAISSDPTTSNLIYINSLCGYLVETAYPESVAPSIGVAYGGSGGNIKGLADEVNPWFEAMVRDAGMEQATGPTGVIFMDYVTNDMSAIGAIIANNFKF